MWLLSFMSDLADVLTVVVRVLNPWDGSSALREAARNLWLLSMVPINFCVYVLNRNL